MSDVASPLADFGGIVRLFPLPGLVFFPHVVQPLHIFEPRYRQMTADALAGDQLITMVLPRPGWEEDYDGRPALHPVACVGQVVTAHPLPDGRYNLLLRGVSRARILEELPQDKLYRQARVQLLAERPVADAVRQEAWRRRLLEKLPAWFPDSPVVVEKFRQVFLSADLSPGVLCDTLAFALPLDVEVKQALLAELDDEARLVRLLEHLETKTPPAPAAPRRPPLDFSVN